MSKTFPPMTLANMRVNGVRAVIATSEACGHKADVNVDALPETMIVPEAGRRLRCSQCEGKRINTRPAWHTASNRYAFPPGRRERFNDPMPVFVGHQSSDAPFSWHQHVSRLNGLRGNRAKRGFIVHAVRRVHYAGEG